jgi:hypothetical protein
MHILIRGKNYFLLLHIFSVSDVGQIEIHKAGLLVPDFSPFEIKIVIVKLKKYKLPDSVKILAELVQASGDILLSNP